MALGRQLSNAKIVYYVHYGWYDNKVNLFTTFDWLLISQKHDINMFKWFFNYK